MPGKTIAIAAAVLLILAVFDAQWLEAAPHSFSTGFRAGGGMEIAASEPLPAKAQGAAGAGPFVEFQFNRWVGLGLAVQPHVTFPSDLSAGFQYRGHWGTDLRPYLSVRWLEHPASGALELVAGNLLGPVIRYDRYFLTYRYFFYLGVSVEPYLELHFRQGAGRLRHSLVTSLPLDLYFRRDVSFSAGTGLAVAWKLYVPKAVEGQAP
ncbi:MAG: hypothetical protein JW820_07465 [Spirochaetales bacterium]|nr:hypothetical protein [Spirochaetales bacterium]